MEGGQTRYTPVIMIWVGILYVFAAVTHVAAALVIPDVGLADILRVKAHIEDAIGSLVHGSGPEMPLPPVVYISGEDRKAINNEYIVMFRDSVGLDLIQAHIALVESMLLTVSESAPNFGSNSVDTLKIMDEVLGYVVRVTDSRVLELIKSYDSLVESIEPNSEVSMNKVEVQEHAPWGISRISQRERIFPWNDLSFSYNSETYRGDVNVYVIDTGIQVTHKDFGGRAKWGTTVINNDNDIDKNGHGTHCAGIIGSEHFGVAKGATLIAVKVLHSDGNGEMSDVLKGIEFVVDDHIKQTEKNKKLKGSVANMSLGAGKSPALVKMVDAAVKKGVHFVVAAGNEDQDACYTSPSDSQLAFTVGATTSSDERAWFSNWGKCVDIFAPGTSIQSSFIGSSNNATEVMTGTSMSAPHVAGLVAYFLSLQPESDSTFYSSVTPEQLRTKIVNFGTKDKIYNVGEFSPNVMAFNGAGKRLDDFWNSN